ncbi:putative chromatin regulator PHD family [Arabidopsis thaliana]|uniref:Zinc finger PHD-type domain-containing protein n=2 Tax=Arabidopsis TaxID=3701 RepID=A0A178VFC3_ARATH|nr:DC1 [Arabidopsis thaliana x Arabidopsis arenosa]OAP05147.1 hypothetical protein AXX17_AT3G32330 [Arabidopsis thaliana]
MDSVEVLPIHEVHWMKPVRDRRMGDCCGIKFEAISDGYSCTECDFFAHKRCSNPPEAINHISHECVSPQLIYSYNLSEERCGICREEIPHVTKVYTCRWGCGCTIHMDCVKYPPPEVINVPKNHGHKLMLEKMESCFTCTTCGKDGDGYSYKCHECHLTFHVGCQKYEAEVNHPSHSLHPLKLLNGEPPAYTNGKCHLCGKKLVDEAFYHCSTCNFTLDLKCVQNPPQLHLHDLERHDHKIMLMPKLISFTCTLCGLNGDQSPYVCPPCNFTAHNDCSGFPWVININRHDHRVSRTALLGVVNSVCGVCRKKMDWSCGGFSCQKCPNSTFHTKCATREDVWDGMEMKDEPEEDEDIEPLEVIDENTVEHFIHYHYLRLDKSGIFTKERTCKACAYPIYHHSFYKCMICDFVLHESCANMPKRKRHMVSNKPYELQPLIPPGCSRCEACGVHFHGFKYGEWPNILDVRCASVHEPFFHKSHPEHPLFYTTPQGVCSACNKEATHVLRCVEDNCGYVLDFKCALLPYEVKHRVDDHFLSFCYGESASGKYWCDICEKETDPTKWFYTCKDCGVTLHIDCVLGDFRAIEPGTKVTNLRYDYVTSFAVRNNSMSRPFCSQCKTHCIYPTILKVVDDGVPDKYYCSINCLVNKYIDYPKHIFSLFRTNDS